MRMRDRMTMKPALTITTTILVCVLAAGLASAQSPKNAHNPSNAASNKPAAASNQAQGNHHPAPKPAAASAPHAPAKKHAEITTAPRSAPPKVPSSPSGERQASAKGTSHHRGHWVHGVWVEEFVPGAQGQHTPGQQTEDAREATGASGNVPANSENAGNGPTEQQVAPDSKYSANGRRDPFISPVVSHAGGSGCSTGKKCLEIGAINLRGVVRAESGFIAVVSNSMNKAYFLRENDPVFNGYVMRITGDSIVFQETLQDKMGKSFTREVVKKITTPAV
jgi:hypothetical protein